MARLSTRVLDVPAAYLGMTVRHAASQKVYTVDKIVPARGELDTVLRIKSPSGMHAYVGTGFIDPDQFVSLH